MRVASRPRPKARRAVRGRAPSASPRRAASHAASWSEASSGTSASHTSWASASKKVSNQSVIGSVPLGREARRLPGCRGTGAGRVRECDQVVRSIAHHGTLGSSRRRWPAYARLRGMSGLILDRTRRQGRGRHRRRAHAFDRPAHRGRAGAAPAATWCSPAPAVRSSATRTTRRQAGWRDIDSVADEVRALGRRALPVVSDVVRPRRGRHARRRRCVDELGRVDIVVNNAGAARGDDRVPVVDLARRRSGAP